MLKKFLAHAEPPGSRHSKARPKRKLELFLPIIHQILEEDRQAPKKQRHTAKRIFEWLHDEHGFQGGKTVVKDAVRAWTQSHQEVFRPPSLPPGEAQVDFGEATAKLNGEERKVALFVMTLPVAPEDAAALSAVRQRLQRVNMTDVARRSLGDQVLLPAEPVVKQRFFKQPRVQVWLLRTIARAYLDMALHDEVDKLLG